MKSGSYDVKLTAGRETIGGYWEMPNDTQYGVTVGNNSGYLAEAEVKVNGKEIGTFMIRRGEQTFWHPVGDQGVFTTIAVNSSEAIQSGNDKVTQDSGLIEVNVYPCRETELWGLRVDKWRFGLDAMEARLQYGLSASEEAFTKRTPLGAVSRDSHSNANTVLTGESDQRYSEVAPLTRTGNVVRFVLRIVVPKPSRKVYRALTNAPPLL